MHVGDGIWTYIEAAKSDRITNDGEAACRSIEECTVSPAKQITFLRDFIRCTPLRPNVVSRWRQLMDSLKFLKGVM